MYGYRTVVRCRSSGYRVIIVVIEWYCAVFVFMSSGYRAVIVYRAVIIAVLYWFCVDGLGS